jgi:Icc-related predicted phosphoesterase
MDEVILMVSDLHSDFELAKSAGTFSHRHKAPVIYTGDYVNDAEFCQAINEHSQLIKQLSQAKREGRITEENQEEITQALKESASSIEAAGKKLSGMYETLDGILKEYACGAYGVLGNHDPKEIAEAHMKNLIRLEGKRTVIGRQAYYGIRHFSIPVYEPDFLKNPYANIPADLEALMKVIDKVDVVIMHEGAHENLSHEGKTHDKALAEALKKHGKGILCGHIHTPYHQLKGQELIRPGPEGEGMIYVKVFFPHKYALMGMGIQEFKKKYQG